LYPRGRKWQETGEDYVMRTFITCMLHCILLVIKSRMSWVGHETHRRMRCSYKIFIGKLERKRPLRRPRHRWEDNIKVGLRKIGWEIVD
jgi:hypothetical protein